MNFLLHPQAQPIIDTFLANGGKSFEKIGEVTTLRAIYENNCSLAVMQDLEHIQSFDISDYFKSEPIKLRIYDQQIDRQQVRPTVLFIHGGGWVMGSLNSHDSICRKLAEVAAVRVIAVDYRLSPEVKFPVPLEDCQRALQYIIDHQAELSVDPTRMVVVGDSAGGNLAGHVGQNFFQRYGYALKAQVLLYPVIAYLPESESYQIYQTGFPLVASTMHWFFEQLFSSRQQHSQISLLEQPFITNNGDIFLITLEHDPLRDEALLYLDKAVKNGLNVEYHHLKGLMHGVFALAGKLPVAEQYLELVGQYIAKRI